MPMTDPPPEPSEPPAATDGGPTGRVVAALAVVVVAVLVAPVLVAIVHAARGGGAGSEAVGSSSGSPSASSSASATTSAPQRSARCWDGSTARQVTACSEPQGAAGLAYVFPSIDPRRCGRATDSGPAGIVLRRVCRARVDGDARAVITYYQWPTSAAAVAYVRGKGLTPADARAPTRVRLFLSAGPGRVRVAAVYDDEPFCYVATLPAGADLRADVGSVVSARPAGQVRGVVRR